MRVTIRVPAGPGARFTEQAARSFVGQTPIVDHGPGRVVAAELIEDGAAVLLTIESADVDA